MIDLRTDPQLLAAFRRGDRAVMARVYDDYLPRVTRMLQSGFTVLSTGLRVPPLEDPDVLADALQQTFMHAFSETARRGYDGVRDYAPYLMNIARNTLVSMHRKHGREIPSSSDRDSYADVDVRDAEPEPDPARSHIEQRATALLDEFLASLPERERKLHKARWDDDRTQADIAAELGISRTRVEQLEHRILRDLHRLLTRAGIYLIDDRLTPTPRGSHG